MQEQQRTPHGRNVVFHRTHHSDGKRTLHIDNHISTTKYHWYSFIFVNLFQQFSRVANFYFLIIVFLLCLGVGPITATSAVLPLSIVILISMFREGVEDVFRYRSDQKVNATLCKKLSNGQWIDAEWQSILVGEFVYLKKDEQVPADIVLISTSDEKDGIAYIDTCNLDGETNLKVRQCSPLTLNKVSPGELASWNGSVLCDQPNNLLYTFNGCMTLSDGTTIPLDNNAVILRGCVLKNTDWAIGLAVYTGLESKLMMNSSAARTKRSRLESSINFKLIVIFFFIGLTAIILSCIGIVWQKHHVFNKDYGYFYGGTDRSLAYHFAVLLVSHITTINAMIPISLYVTLEIVRVFQALFIAWDANMYDEETETGAAARTTNISDDLGQISYIFSDKTGTLTRNVMEFMKCSIAGKVYGSGVTEVAYAAAKRRGIPCNPPSTKGKAFHDDQFAAYLRGDTPMEIKHFLYLLSICHSVIPEEDATQEHGIRYQASSPDEAALVSAAADLGYVFTSRSSDSVTVKINGKDTVVEVLAVLEFTSERKRSSVIIKHPETGEIVLYCKGADDLICQRLAPSSLYLGETREHLKQFAADGLRTLCCAMKVIPNDFYAEWSKRFHDANCAIEGRDELIDRCANEIECDLQLVGATAIEDKLQEGVPDTIEALLRAGINVWVITGDKRETAINIGFACSLLSGDMKLTILDSDDLNELETTLASALDNNNQNKQALIASGAALVHLLDDEHAEAFYQLSQRCQSVICCRVSPLQKATIVRIMREKTGKEALAIGDGANDVGMILEADIGVGISGKEGRQAVLSSDYSFAKFKFLKRLLLVHGRLCFSRNVDLVNYSFYKNMAFSLNQIFFDFFTGWSGNTVFDSILYTVFNVIFTSVPPVIFAGLERDVGQQSMMEIPELYDMNGKKDYYQSYIRFVISLLLGAVHAAVSFFVPYFGMQPFVNQNGLQLGYREFGVTVYGCVVMIVNLRIAALCQYWTWLHHLFIWGSILIYPLVVIVVDFMGISPDVKGLSLSTFSCPQFYWSVIGTAVLALFPVVFQRTISNSLNNVTNRVLLHEREKKLSSVREEIKNLLPPEAPKEEVDVYPDQANATGYNFDAPAPVTRLIFQTRNNQFNTMPNQAIDYNSIRTTRVVSSFGLDEL